MKKDKPRACRRVSVHQAGIVAGISILFSGGFAALRLIPLTEAESVLLRILELSVCFLLPAYAGLLVLSGDQRKQIRLQQITMNKAISALLMGITLYFPCMLLRHAEKAALGHLGIKISSNSGFSPRLFLLNLLMMLILEPFVVSLYYDGYLFGAFRGRGRLEMLIPVGAFALQMTFARGLMGAIITGILLVFVYRQSDNLLTAILFLIGTGLSGLVWEPLENMIPMGILPVLTTLAGVLGISVFSVNAKDYFSVPRGEKPMVLPKKLRFTRNDKALLILMSVVILFVILSAEVLS